jgi:mono/diheme cytochrome c family protein
MPRRTLMLLTIATVAASVTAFAFGGWASISIDELPDHFTVGRPTQLSFVIKQHGITPLDDLSPTVDARTTNGAGRVQALATRGSAKGQYVATLTFPTAGDWRVTVKSGFGPSDLTLLPMPALAANEAVPALTDYEHGRRLFVAKGCVNCHVHNSVDSKPLVESGPNLTEKKFDGAYLALWLANPAIRPPTNSNQVMPNPRLSPREIGALVAFVNNGKVAAAR